MVPQEAKKNIPIAINQRGKVLPINQGLVKKIKVMPLL